jgi:hypothetical protein
LVNLATPTSTRTSKYQLRLDRVDVIASGKIRVHNVAFLV